jgi:hypothetical protein
MRQLTCGQCRRVFVVVRTDASDDVDGELRCEHCAAVLLRWRGRYRLSCTLLREP